MVDLTAFDYGVAGAAALGAGLVNALAGGGTLISFPALIAIGLPSITANITNTVALCLGYFGGALAQRAELRGERHRLPPLMVAGAVGGLAGSLLLVVTPEDAFSAAVPFLILTACALLAAQEPVRRSLNRRRAAAGSGVAVSGVGSSGPAERTAVRPSLAAVVGVGVAAIYGGFFGAGLGIMLLAVLGVLLEGSLTRLNAMKSVLSLVINLVAAVFFVASSEVEWRLAPLMAVTSLLGGILGGRLAGRVSPRALRTVVIAFGVVVAVVQWL